METAHSGKVTLPLFANPRKGGVADERDQAMALFDQVSGGLKLALRTVISNLIKGPLAARQGQVIAGCHEGEAQAFHQPDEVWVEGSRQDQAIRHSLLLKNWG